MPKEEINWSDFAKIDIRIGTIVSAEIFEEARNPAYKLSIDFGDIGIKKSSAQITKLYETNDIVGKQVVAVVNFPPKQIANIMSECLLLGGLGINKEVVLLQPERFVQNGTEVG
ncbi:tRNA-binding protein [Aquimarina sp. U1-2]|uniref:tRNA-binding protein n=1 Tax=Aquimarina sp. U1-2 TaxID=2823141 RepID=UPI001AECA566|nr:tRNA-binding protein [Aquimarina sp. U1-2]MBP2833587.1 tRNA-binding protein [Aquimarina sp. U1-2]